MTRNIRLATPADVGALEMLIERSTRVLLVPFLTPEQLVASFEVMTLDTQLIDDGTYFIAEEGGVAVGCGGWTRRRRFITTQRRPDRDCELLAPGREPARVRAMYTDPNHATPASAASYWRPARTRRARPVLPKANSWRHSQVSRSTWPPDGGKPSAPSLRRA